MSLFDFIEIRRMILIFIISTFLLFTNPIQAQEFVPFQNNPIIIKDPSHGGYVQPYVLKDQTQFSLWFADNDGSRHRIVRMQSANGIDWYDKQDTKVTDRNNAHDPFIFFDNNQYDLYFASSNFGNISLWKSTSSDGITYAAGTEKEILKSEKSWEGSNLSCPAVIKENNTYYLFYAGSGVSNWGIGLATSNDGQNWQRCPNNPFIAPGASGHIIKYNDIFYLFFQSPNGLEVQQTNFLNYCNTVWTNRHVINNPLRDPSPIQVGNNLWLYGTLPTDTGLHIGLATNTSIPLPTYPIVIVPGMFASWNSQAILHNIDVTYDTWKLNPNVSEYDAIIQTLQNQGRTQNKDLFIFNYDWRKPLTETVQNLNNFLSNIIWSSNPHQPVQLIGHSLGGVITRLYAQQNDTKPIKNIVTAGSPLLGTPQSYKPLAGGEIDRENTLMWMAEKLIVLLNKSKIESDKDTITRMLPVLSDLLPTFPYLKNQSGSYIVSSLLNTTLSNMQINPSISQLYIGGTGYQVNAGYVLGSRTVSDDLLNTYPDGHPQSSWAEDGDGVTLLKSSFNQISPAPTSNHGEIIFEKNNIKTILSSLGIETQDENIPIGQGTSIFPTILTFIQSPAVIEIEHNGTTHKENDGLIWIQNAENGTYTLNVDGVGEGEYTTSVWLIGTSGDKWIQFKKTASVGSKDTFIISFDSQMGGGVEEYVIPSPTLIPSPTPTVTVTLIPTEKPKPTRKPNPTTRPIPTTKPSITPKPYHGKWEDKKIQEYFEKLIEMWRRIIEKMEKMKSKAK